MQPELTWVDTLCERLRWQSGALAQQYVIVFRPAGVSLGNQPWLWWYTTLSVLSMFQFFLCCNGYAIFCIITELGREYTPLRHISVEVRDIILNAVIWGNLIFPWIWVAWSSMITYGYVKYTDSWTTSVMIGSSLALSAVTMVVNFISLTGSFNTDFSPLLVHALHILPYEPTNPLRCIRPLDFGSVNVVDSNRWLGDVWTWRKLPFVLIEVEPFL